MKELTKSKIAATATRKTKSIVNVESKEISHSEGTDKVEELSQEQKEQDAAEQARLAIRKKIEEDSKKLAERIAEVKASTANTKNLITKELELRRYKTTKGLSALKGELARRKGQRVLGRFTLAQELLRRRHR